MNIVHVLWSLEFGGIGRLVFDLASEQRRRGINARVLAGQAKGRMVPLFSEAGIPVYDANLKNGFDPGLFQINLIRSALKTADIIHMHSFNPTLARYARCSGKPIIFTEHGNFGHGRVRSWREKLKLNIMRRFLNYDVCYVTFNSHYSRGIAFERYGLDKVPSKVVYNGISFDEERHCSTPLDGLPSRKFVVGTASRLVGVKRIDRLIRAFSAMKERDDCLLLIVGDGVLREKLEELVRIEGLIDKVEFVGYQRDVTSFQAIMDVCVVPSQGESFGLVALETLALGKPTIVMNDGGGITEIIAPLSPDDVVAGISALARRLEHYYKLWRSRKLDDPEQITARIRRAREFDIRLMADHFDEIYMRVSGL